MEAQAIIHHRLDLVLRLVNAVTGQAVESAAQFIFRSPNIKPISRGAGVYIVLNMERNEMDIEVHAYGYEPQKVKITYPDTLEQMPIRDIYLLPKDAGLNDDMLTLRGNLAGIEKIEAVSLTETYICIKEFDARKKIMKVLNQRNLRFNHIHYGLVNQSKDAYEHFSVVKEISTEEIKCDRALEQTYSINQPIARIVFGQVNEQGDYVLKVASEENPRYLVRFVVHGKQYFQTVDFSQTENALSYEEHTEEE